MTSPSIGAFRVDALRRAVEASTADEYASRGYYEKWVYALRDLLIEQGVVSQAEVDARIAELAASESAKAKV